MEVNKPEASRKISRIEIDKPDVLRGNSRMKINVPEVLEKYPRIKISEPKGIQDSVERRTERPEPTPGIRVTLNNINEIQRILDRVANRQVVSTVLYNIRATSSVSKIEKYLVVQRPTPRVVEKRRRENQPCIQV
uniref:DUF2382 domain-containing protein n=1 Tax=Strongyloides venezuelensis TaxID=75913 RepID=A0A0K0FPK9_STRVS